LGERCGPLERLGHRKAYRTNAASIASTVSNLKSLPAAFGISRPTRMPYLPAEADIFGGRLGWSTGKALVPAVSVQSVTRIQRPAI
jgi:hypothetical protein